MSKDYFIHIGKYDEGMDIWGFENVEISLRVSTQGYNVREMNHPHTTNFQFVFIFVSKH